MFLDVYTIKYALIFPFPQRKLLPLRPHSSQRNFPKSDLHQFPTPTRRVKIQVLHHYINHDPSNPFGETANPWSETELE